METRPADLPAVPVETTASPLGSSRRHLAGIFALFLLSRLLVAVTGQLAWNYLPICPQRPSDPPLTHGNLMELFVRYDARYYLSLVDNGYAYHLDPDTNQATGNVGFYPLYPLLVRAVRLLVPSTLTAGYLVSNALLLAACFLLWELAKLELRSPRAALWAVAFLLFCPGSAWLSMVFTESCFLLLLLTVMWGCRRRRWLLVAGAAFLLSLTRAIGVVALVFIVLEVWTDWRERRYAGQPPAFDAAGYAARALAVAAPVLGYVAFYVFLQVRFGDWHAQHKLLASNWPVNAQLVTPWAAIAREWPAMHNGKRLIIYGLLTGAVILSALSLRVLRRPSYPAVALALITMCVIATYHSPMARYLSVVAPLHLTLGGLAAASRPVGWVLLPASAALMVGLTAAAVNGFLFF